MHKHPSPSTPARSHGSVLILVVAAIAMLAFLGGLFLTAVHTQRTVTPDAGNNRSSSRQTDINVVLESVNEEIARQIKEDVFNPADSATRPGVAFDNENGVEVTDRAWINNNTGTRRAFDFDGTPAGGLPLIGGNNDDTWLASTFPHRVDGDPANPWVWSRISSLTGASFEVDDVDGSLNTGNDRRVDDQAPGRAGADFYERTLAEGGTYNIPAYERGGPNIPLLVDADGDGVPDSRFERAPIAARDGIEYFMAVRVIDLASLLNINTAATALDGDADYLADPDGPRTRNPGDLDAGQFLAMNKPLPAPGLLAPATASDPADGRTFLREFIGETGGTPGLLNFRGGTGATTPGTPPDADDRATLYENAGPYVDPSAGTRRFSSDFERELRYRNGTYDLPEPGPLRDFAPQLAVEPRNSFPRGGIQVRVRNEPLRPDSIERYYGYDRMLPPSVAVTAPDTRSARAPRAYLTTRSAANRWRIPLPGEAASSSAANPGLREKYDLNDASLRPEKTKVGTGTLTSGDRFPTYTPGEAELEELEIALRGGVVGTPPANATELGGIAGLAYRSAAAPGTQADPNTSAIDPFPVIPNADRPVLPQSSVVAATLPATPPAAIPFSFASLERFSLQFAANVQDFRDADNRLTRLAIPGSGGQSVYGMEALPAINEVYAHRLYEAVASAPVAGNFDIDWEQKGSVGYAIEIINPHTRPISLQNVHAFIVWDDAGSSDETYLGELSVLAEDEVAAANGGVPADNPQTVFDESRMLQPGETVVIYRDAVSAGGDPSNDANQQVLPLIDVVAGTESIPSDEAFQDAPDGTVAVDWPTEVDTGNYINVRVELRAEQMEQSLTSFPNAGTGGGILPFAYQAAPSISLPEAWQQDGVAIDHAAGATVEQRQGFLQVTSQGSSVGINPLLLTAARFTFDASLAALNDPTPTSEETVRAPRPPAAGAPAGTGATFTVDLETLGEAKPSPTRYTEIPADEGQWLLSDGPTHRLSSVGPIAAMLVLGPQERTGTSPLSGRTVAEVVDHEASTATYEPELRDMMLRLDNGAPTPPAPGRVIDTRASADAAPDWRIPHFIHLLDTFRVDDKPTPTSANPTFAGALNLNTVRLPMLADVLPVVDVEVRRLLAAMVGDRLFDYDASAGVDDGRSQPGNGTNPPQPGVPAVLDFSRANNGDFFAASPNDIFELTTTGIPDSTQSDDHRIDRVPDPRVSPDPDGVIGDREEEILAADLLNDVGTTRSDVFCAYVLLHGYKSDDIGAGPVKVLRSITLFDRSQMETVEDDVKVEVLMRLAESPKR